MGMDSNQNGTPWMPHREGGAAVKKGERSMLLRYTGLCERFLDKRISGDEFRGAYFELSGTDENLYEDERISRLMDWIYPEIDVYEPNLELLKTLQAEKPNWYLGDEEIRIKVQEFVSKLKPLIRNHS